METNAAQPEEAAPASQVTHINGGESLQSAGGLTLRPRLRDGRGGQPELQPWTWAAVRSG